MLLYKIQNVTPFSSLVVIIIGMTFSYAESASKGNFSLFECSSSNASSRSQLKNGLESKYEVLMIFAHETLQS